MSKGFVSQAVKVATPEPAASPVPQGVRWPLALAGQFLFVFAALGLTGPGRIDIVDGQTRYEVARSLLEHGDSIIRDKDVTFRVHKGRDGKKYTPYRFPQSGLGVVAILLADATGPVCETRRQFFFTLISAAASALLAVGYAVWFRGLGLSAAASLGWSTAGIFCTPCWFYGTSTFDDMLGTLALVLAVGTAFLWRERRPWLGAALAGLWLGWAVNCKEPLALFVLPVLAAAYVPSLPVRRQWVPAALIVGGLALGLGAYKAYEWYKFPPGSVDHNAEYEELYGAMWTRDPVPGLAGLTMSPSAGFLWYCPTMVLSLVGWSVWWRRNPWFCAAVAAASLLFTVFLSFLTFFKGEPCWGPRYLTPVFALWWVFVPAALTQVRPLFGAAFLTLGCLVQLLGLSVDPQRLLLAKAIPFNYYTFDPWLQFHPEASHLLQRPGEIRDILQAWENRVPEYTPAPLPTFASQLRSGFPLALTGAVGQVASPVGPRPLLAMHAIPAGMAGNFELQFKGAVKRYRVFASFRPWWISQQYLAPEERPVAFGHTLVLLLTVSGVGLGLMLLARRRSGAVASLASGAASARR